jgi:hypothetical protein
MLTDFTLVVLFLKLLDHLIVKFCILQVLGLIQIFHP